MKISVKKAADKFKLPVDCVLYYAKEELQIQEMTEDSPLNEYALASIKNRLLEAAEWRKTLYFLVEKGIETKVLDASFQKRNSKLILQWGKVLALRFGYGVPRHALKTIGDIFGVSKERVRQAEGEILKYLKHPKIVKELKEQFDYGAYTPKIEASSWSVALINFANNNEENKNV